MPGDGRQRGSGPFAGTSAGRVIAGSARGIRLAGPGQGTRPLGDRVKQSLFAILEPSIRDRRFLDLYAGSGAAGIEALSRGASGAVFVESDRAAVETIIRNLASTGLAGDSAAVVRARVLDWLPRSSPAAFGAIFVDPPYDSPGELERVLGVVARAGPGGILADDGVLVAKHFGKAEVPAEIGLLRSFRQERFGDTVLTFSRWADEIASHGVAS